MGVLLLVRFSAGHRLPLPIPGSSLAAARLPGAGRRLPRQRLLESPALVPSHGDKDSVLPGAERLRDGGPTSLPELPVAWALCQPREDSH